LPVSGWGRPQREALQTAFGLSAGPAPDRFLVGLAVLSLLSDAAEEQPLICLVDDQQWLDHASAQALGFAARRLEAESVGLVFAARQPSDHAAGLPELVIEGLREDDARALLDSVLTGLLDARVRDRIVAETRGNPLALLELRLDAALARETYLEALGAAVWAGDLGLPGGVRAAAEAAPAAPPASGSPRVVDVLLDALALRLTEGFAVAAPTLTRALELVLAPDAAPDLEAGRWLWPTGAGASQMVAQELWDAEPWHALTAHLAQFARDTGALVLLQFGLIFLVVPHLLAGELATAARLIEEDRLIADATGNPPVAYTAMALAAWRGQEGPASELIEATVQEATARGQGRLVSLADYASSVLYNGLGRHDAARDAAWRAFCRDPVGYGPFLVPELAEAASRTGDVTLVRAALDWLSERTAVTPTDWSLGIQAQIARLARDGLSNPEIGARLFISARTVQYHLGKVFTKLAIGSRSQLDRALPGDPDTVEQGQGGSS
jgi:Bacterial regulatory proteins, luxR family